MRLLALVCLLALPAAALAKDPPARDDRAALKRFAEWWKPKLREFSRARTMGEKVGVVRELAARREVVAGQVLSSFLQRQPMPIKIAAAQGLAHARHAVHTPLVLKGLDVADELELRVELVHTLGEIGDERAVEELLKFLQRPDHLLIRSTLRALRKIGARSSVRPLLQYALQVLPPKQFRGHRMGTKNRFDWDRFDDIEEVLLETLEALTKVRFQRHEDWRDYYNENKDQFK